MHHGRSSDGGTGELNYVIMWVKAVNSVVTTDSFAEVVAVCNSRCCVRVVLPLATRRDAQGGRNVGLAVLCGRVRSTTTDPKRLQLTVYEFQVCAVAGPAAVVVPSSFV